MDKNNLSIITVTFNNEDLIIDYINSLLKNIPESCEIIIVNNNSTDNTLKLIPNNKKIKVIENNKNLGFARACNLGVNLSSGEYIFFLNPDTKVEEGSILKLLEFIKNHKEAIVAPKLVEFGGKTQPSVRKLPTIIGAIREYYLGVKDSYEAYAPQGEEIVEVESVVGGALMVTRKLFLKVGGFDEKFFLYFEDLDLCRKVRNLGYKIYYLPNAIIKHKVGGSMSENKLKWLNDSAKAYHGTIYNGLLNLILRFRIY